MLHQLKLQERFFDYIENGTKRIELRLYDEKRRAINLGDEIEFLKLPDLEDKLKVKVCGLLRYSSFSDLFKDFDINILADKSMSKEELLDALQEFYTPEEQEKYGVLGIRINPLK